MMSYLVYINTLILIATIFAIIYGPIKAVKITRSLDEERAVRERKFSVYRDLMQTRSLRLDPLHVGALNLVELEFYSDGSVREAYRHYIRHLNSPLPNPDEQDRYFEERFDLFADLLHRLGENLGYHFDKRELARFSYAPVGWANDTEVQKKNAMLLTQVLEGVRPLPVAPYSGQQKSPFPPPPEH